MASYYATLLAELADLERQPTPDPNIERDIELVLERLRDLAVGAGPEDDDSRPSTPIPSSPVRLAPPPPPGAPRKPITTIRPVGLSRSGRLMTQLSDGMWVPAPPLFVDIPEGPPPPTEAPPPPKAADPICNCDADGECSYCEEERWGEDTREGCARCPGCTYCEEERYDEA